MFPSCAAELCVHAICHSLQAQAFSQHFIEILRKTGSPYSCNERELHLKTLSSHNSSQSCIYRLVNYNFLIVCQVFDLSPSNFRIPFLNK